MVVLLQGYRYAYGCFVTKVTSVPMVVLLPKLPLRLCLLCYQGYQRAFRYANAPQVVPSADIFKFVYCVYGSFNDAVSDSDCFASNGRVIKE
jgi:hypothetical protein